ncbi:hypothetical protein Tco_0606551, partial [Tanacetum coccineum]
MGDAVSKEGRYALDKSLHGHSQQGSSTGPLLSDDMETERGGIKWHDI